jgi:plasmid replication initiation protein
MTHQEITTIDWNKSLVRWNDLTSASYTLSPDAHRILAVAISAIAKDDQNFMTFRIYTKQLIDFYPALKNDKNAIARIDQATDSLMSAHIKIKQKNGWLKRHLIHSCQFVKNNGYAYVDIKLNNDMQPYLIGVKGYFSAPKLENIKHFKKDQHFKLHAYLFSYLYRGTTGNVSIEQIREILDIDKKQYKLVWHLKSRLLLPSIEFINAVTDIKVTIKDVKHGRRIAGFKFNISKRIPIQITPEQTVDKVKPKITHIALADQYKAIGVKAVEFEKLSKKHDQTYLKQLLIYAQYRAAKQTIQSMFKYLCGVLNNKPQLEDLYTPNCLLKQKQAKQKLVEAHQQQTNNRQTQDKADEFQALSKKVEQYLSSCSESQLQAIRQAFKQTAFVIGLTKIWKSIDLKKPYIKAMYYRFVFKNKS